MLSLYYKALLLDLFDSRKTKQNKQRKKKTRHGWNVALLAPEWTSTKSLEV